MAVHSDVVETKTPSGMLDVVAVSSKCRKVFIADRTWINRDAGFTFKTIKGCGILEFEPELLAIKHLAENHVVSSVTESGQ